MNLVLFDQVVESNNGFNGSWNESQGTGVRLLEVFKAGAQVIQMALLLGLQTKLT